MIKTTVVIPNYNGIKYIDNCIASLYKGAVVPEVIVVDNHSEDGSPELVKEKYPGVRLITFTENKGFSAAVNEGIKEAHTKYVLLLNNDTVADGRMVTELEKAMEKNPGAFSAAAKMINLHTPDKLDGAGDFYCALGWAFARGKDKNTDSFNRPGRIFSSCAGAALYRRKMFDNIGYFDENHFAYLEDIDLGYRANIYGYPNIYVPEAEVLHAGSAVSGSRHNTFKVRLSARNSVYLIYKNMPLFQVLLNLPFLMAGYLIKWFFFTLKGMGGVYLEGVIKGLRLSLSEKGRKNKVRFSIGNLKNYIWIQEQLWLNMLRRIF
ncbi:glycosyltransferase family 2 protein [Parablautia intestinalis]|uniref:Glycosyltransferase family 2 protein n=1 Tax=Parablautia intestinalis TaxID=2320100 RepID=A0A3A9B3N0_9FIRM|nr:glycosyltransferase family 2 protein [Parablautia intestinalis]RKI94096.1 glycosyltransferase family 2 protein [Parablautia intestinalis]